MMPLAFPWLPRSTPESGTVKWDGMTRHSNGDDAVGNALKWDQRQRETVGPVWLIEPPHFLLSQSCGLVRVLCPVVQPFVLPMLHARQDFALRQKLFSITKTERETEIQPHSMTHDFRREAETFVIGSNSVCFHKAILAYCSALLPS